MVMNVSRKFGDLENYSIFIKNGKMGLMGTPNNEPNQMILTEPQYDLIYPFVGKYSVVKKGIYYGVINKFGEEIIPTGKYIFLSHVPESYHQSDYFHVQDEKRNVYDLDINENPIVIKGQDERWRIKAANAAKIDYYNIIGSRFSKGLFVFGYNNEEYVYNIIKDRIVFRGKNIKIVNENLIVAQNTYSKKYGIIDHEGNTLTSFVYDGILTSSSGDIDIPEKLFDAKKEGKCGYIDYKGRIKIPFDYHFCGTFRGGFAWVTNEIGKTGLINQDGVIVEPLIHDNILYLSNDTIVYIDYVSSTASKYNIKDAPKGSIKQSPKHVHFRFNICANYGYVQVSTIDGKKGITNLYGSIDIPAEYDEIRLLDNYNVLAKLNNKWGAINLKNCVEHSFEFDSIDTIKIPSRGILPIYHFIVCKTGKFGILDNQYKECLPIIYDGIRYSEKYKCYVVRIGNENAMLDFENNIIVPFTKESLNYL